MDFILPKIVSEATLQAEFYSECKNKSIDCVLQHSYKDCRFDAVIVYKNKIVLIIEIKKYSKKYGLDEYYSSQIEKYERFGVPVVVLTRRKDIVGLVKHINLFLIDGCNIEYLNKIKYYRKSDKKSKVSKRLTWTCKQRKQYLNSY